MSSSGLPYQPPTQTLTDFNNAVFQSGTGLTLNQANGLFVQYPNAQGTCNFPLIKSPNPIQYTYSTIPTLTNQQTGYSLAVYNTNTTTSITTGTPAVLCYANLPAQGIYMVSWSIYFQTTSTSTVTQVSSYLTGGIASGLIGGTNQILPYQTQSGSFALSNASNTGVIQQNGSAIINTANWGSLEIALCYEVLYTGSAMNILNIDTGSMYFSGYTYVRIA